MVLLTEFSSGEQREVAALLLRAQGLEQLQAASGAGHVAVWADDSASDPGNVVVQPGLSLSAANLAAIDPDGRSRVLVFFSHPATELARAMDAGEAPGDALETWLVRADDLVELVRSEAERVLLVELETALANPDAFRQAVSQRFGIDLPLNDKAKPSQPEAVIPLYGALAEAAVRRSPSAQEKLAILRALAAPLGKIPEEMEIEVDAVFRSLKQVDTAEEIDLREENRQLRDQLAHVQDAIESYYLDFLQSETIRQEHAGYEKELWKIRHSFSWRITAPVRLGGKVVRKLKRMLKR